MSCVFLVTGDFERARDVVLGNGGAFEGDAGAGKFSGKGVEGEYRKVMGGDEYVVVISRKPWLVSCGYVERKVREFFAQQRR